MPAEQRIKDLNCATNVPNGDKKLINNIFRMDMCDNICKLIIVPRRVTFTSEHRTSKTEQSDLGWWLGGNPGVWILLPFQINLDPTHLDTLIL